jgi:hypothetical protein
VTDLDLDLLAAHLTQPFPVADRDLVSLDAASHRRSSMRRIIRLVERFLAHPLTQASARIALVGVCVVGWSFFFAVSILP